jgi:D-alanyl-D-alanine carboxypeptidase/D-alanyl-D-alanine-endopeptidase (penicillin-binding protein 4)
MVVGVVGAVLMIPQLEVEAAAGTRAPALAPATAALTTTAVPSSGLAARLTPASRTASDAANARIGAVLRSRARAKPLGRRFTMTVWDPTTQRFVFRKQAAASLRGASTTKILTSVAALAVLGPDHRMPTTVRSGAAGELVLVAGGDPLLTSADLNYLATTTARTLAGADAATPSPTPSTSTSASPSASPTPTETTSTNGPSQTATAGSGGASSPSPQTEWVVRADDSLFADQGSSSRGWLPSYLPREVRPVGAFARDDRKVRDSTADAAKYFTAALQKAGLSAKYAGEASADPTARVLATFPGHRVGDAVSRTLLVSDNDTAEMLFRQVALGRGLPASWAGGRRAVTEALGELGVPLAGVRIIDGSGLSLEGRLTSGALTAALSQAISGEHPKLSGLRTWLPVSGRSGTLKAQYQRFASKPSRCAAGLIQAKTGTVADAVSLAGYAQGSDGRPRIFVAIVNSRPTRWSRQVTRQQIDRVASSVTGCW